MTPTTNLTLIKLLHTIIWLLFNVIIFYFLYAVITDTIDYRVWVCLGLLVAEGIVLLVFKSICLVTVLARKYSDSQKPNFDIYLPEWLAKYNKAIYTTIVVIAILILIYRLST